MTDPSDRIDVRRAEPEDIKTIQTIAREAWYAAYGFLSPEAIEAALSDAYDEDLLAGAIDAEGLRLFVADAGDDAGVVGFASAEQTWADELELHTLYVDPSLWGEEIGTKLLSAIEDYADSLGVDRIACGVFTDNTVGVGFLEARGFEAGIETTVTVGGERHTEREYERPL
ncbi:MAG: GNAT family N-acetyltransferase [Natronomonas sp.]